MQVAARCPRAAICAARLVEPPPQRSPRATAWRERPPDMAGWPAKPAGQRCGRSRRRSKGVGDPCQQRQSGESRGEFDAQPARELEGFLDALFTPVLAFRIGTADAARGAATKSGGWRGSGPLSCQSKPMADESASAKPDVASLSTPTTCKLRGRGTSAAFCAAHETHLADVTEGAGA